MEVEKLQVDPTEARVLWRKYLEHKAHQQPYDAEIEAIYKRIAQGKTVIRALTSICAAGLNAEGLPKLAIARADEQTIYWRTYNGYGHFVPMNGWRESRAESRRLRVDWPNLTHQHKEARAAVPLIPVHLRPQRGIQNYHILWEADWHEIPKDPYLLRRFSGDAWLVVAAWDLTEVERAVMAHRLHT
jgi:hypothetical protein